MTPEMIEPRSELEASAEKRLAEAHPPASWHRVLAAAQGAYYVGTGVWPVVHLESFEAVTGPKVDRWLVKTFGTLIAATGAALVVGARERPSRTLVALGAGSALALALADTIYVLKGRISPVYLLDALVEVGLAVAWACVPPT